MEEAAKKRSTLSLTTIEGEDRLSSLPDCLLIAILSLIPFHAAAATSVLSGRWRYLWTHHTHLLFDYYPSKTYFLDFAATVDRILRQLASTKLHSFTLQLHEYSYFQSKALPLTSSQFNHIQSWLSEVCARSPESVTIGTSWYRGAPRLLSVQVPGSLLHCKSLVELSLPRDRNVQIETPHDGCPIHLPNLKKLQMSVSEYAFDFVATLVKSCPLLEHLYLCLCPRGTDGRYSVDIVAPKLKYLHALIGDAYLKVVIHAPILEHFSVEGNLAIFGFVNTPTALLTAQLSFDTTFLCGVFNDQVDYHNRISSLVQEISSATTVVLSSLTVLLLSFLPYGDDNAMPVFRNLSNLLLKINHKVCTSERHRYHMPACFLSNVKRIKISGEFVLDDCNLDLLEYLLRHAMVLEELVVGVSRDDVPGALLRPLCKECNFCTKLSMLPRSSSGCQIHLLGSCVTA